MKTSCVLWLLLSKAHKIIIKGKKKKKNRMSRTKHTDYTHKNGPSGNKTKQNKMQM